MFLKNKYFKWYFNIISKAREKVNINMYVEKHHIIPKSLGGTNDKLNLILLTAKEHFICHLLLTKFTSGKNKNKMVYAIHKMIYSKNKNMNRHRINGNTYEYFRKINSELRKSEMTGKKRSEETKEKISKSKINSIGPNKGKKFSKEHKHKMSISKIGKKISEETKEKISKKLMGHNAHPNQQRAASEVCKNILSKINKGKKRSEYTKKLMSKKLKGRKITWKDKISITRKRKFKDGLLTPHNKIMQWVVTSPDKTVYAINDLKAFCSEHNLPFNTMRRLKDRGGVGKRGPCLGWKVHI